MRYRLAPYCTWSPLTQAFCNIVMYIVITIIMNTATNKISTGQMYLQIIAKIRHFPHPVCTSTVHEGQSYRSYLHELLVDCYLSYQRPSVGIYADVAPGRAVRSSGVQQHTSLSQIYISSNCRCRPTAIDNARRLFVFASRWRATINDTKMRTIKGITL